MNSVNDVSPLCWECVHCLSHGDRIMVGDEEGGGLEEFVSCSKGRNQIALRLEKATCAEREVEGSDWTYARYS